jgi:hypothetical protein
VIKAKCAPYLKRGKPERRTELLNRDDLTIISTYGAEYRSLVQYYLLAGDVWRLSRLKWVAQTPMLKTLEASFDGVGDRPQIQDQNFDTRWATDVLRGQGPTSRQESARRKIRRNLAETAEEGGSTRPPGSPAHCP